MHGDAATVEVDLDRRVAKGRPSAGRRVPGGPLPEPVGKRPSVIVVVPGMEDEVVHDDDLIEVRSMTDAIAERDRKLDVMRAELRREERARLPLLERDEDPEGDPNEVLYFEQQSGWPVTRREHRTRLG